MYKKISLLGQGRDSKAYLIKKDGKEKVMKIFKTGKNIKKEFEFQKQAYALKISPKPYEYDIEKKYIIMEKMDKHLYEEINEKKGVLTQKRQKRILKIFKALDDLKIFHNDPNICNYMIKNGEVYIIDYGFSKSITPSLVKKLGTDRPNSILMVLGLIITLKEKNVPEKSYKLFLEKISREDRLKYGL